MPGSKARKTSTVRGSNDGRRRDSNRVVLKTGEYQRSDDGRYYYKWTDKRGKRHYISAATLRELREKEANVQRDILDGIETLDGFTLNDLFKLWKDMKRGIKNNTMNNYVYMYEQYIRNSIGRYRIKTIKKSTIRSFYNTLIDEGILRISTLDTIQNLLHQTFDIAVDDGYLRNNPADKALTELKRTRAGDVKKVKALTLSEQRALLSFTRNSSKYCRWYPIIAFMTGTGMRVGEVTGLRWVDVDFENGFIDVNHTLVYMNHLTDKHCYYEINTPKTEAGNRAVPMLSMVEEALMLQKEQNEKAGLVCLANIAGYTDFIFLNRFGYTLNNSVINKALNHIIRDYNEEQLRKSDEGELDENDLVLLPRFSCHSLRHTFATRMVEAGVNVKVIQETLGHVDVTTTLNIYSDASEDLKKREFNMLDSKIMEA